MAAPNGPAGGNPPQGASGAPPTLARPAYVVDTGPLPPMIPPRQGPAPAQAAPQAQPRMPGQFPAPAPAPAPAPTFIQVPAYAQAPAPQAPAQPPLGWQPIVFPNTATPAPPPYEPTPAPAPAPGENDYYTTSPYYTRLHVLDSSIEPWKIQPGSNAPIPFKPLFVYSALTFRNFFTMVGAIPDLTAATEVIPGGNGKWYAGVGVKGSNPVDLTRRLMDLGWDGTRTGRILTPGERDAVWVWLNRLA